MVDVGSQVVEVDAAGGRGVVQNITTKGRNFQDTGRRYPSHARPALKPVIVTEFSRIVQKKVNTAAVGPIGGRYQGRATGKYVGIVQTEIYNPAWCLVQPVAVNRYCTGNRSGRVQDGAVRAARGDEQIRVVKPRIIVTCTCGKAQATGQDQRQLSLNTCLLYTSPSPRDS